jgi:hypothetical protein
MFCHLRFRNGETFIVNRIRYSCASPDGRLVPQPEPENFEEMLGISALIYKGELPANNKLESVSAAEPEPTPTPEPEIEPEPEPEIEAEFSSSGSLITHSEQPDPWHEDLEEEEEEEEEEAAEGEEDEEVSEDADY